MRSAKNELANKLTNCQWSAEKQLFFSPDDCSRPADKHRPTARHERAIQTI
jgi:hypothetical protein